MIFGNQCWVDVEAMDKDKVVVLPLGSFERMVTIRPYLPTRI